MMMRKTYFTTKKILDSDLDQCAHSLIGKIMTYKPINIRVFKEVMEILWSKPLGFHVQECKNGLV